MGESNVGQRLSTLKLVEHHVTSGFLSCSILDLDSEFSASTGATQLQLITVWTDEGKNHDIVILIICLVCERFSFSSMLLILFYVLELSKSYI